MKRFLTRMEREGGRETERERFRHTTTTATTTRDCREWVCSVEEGNGEVEAGGGVRKGVGSVCSPSGNLLMSLPCS